MSSVVVVLAAVWAVRNGGLTPVRTVALSLLVGGGAGNLLDRFLRGGYVTDFAIVSVGPLHSGIFNLADLCLVAGVVLYAFASRRRKGPG